MSQQQVPQTSAASEHSILLNSSVSRVPAKQSVELGIDEVGSRMSVGEQLNEQNENADKFFENLLQSSRAQLSRASEGYSETGLELETNSMNTKHSVSPNLSLASPKKRSRKNVSTSQSEDGLSSVENTPRKSRPGSSSQESIRQNRNRNCNEFLGTSASDSSAVYESYQGDDHLRHLSGSTTPDSADPSFRTSMLDDVLTEKKLALLRSPEVVRFLQQQQSQRAQEKRLAFGMQQSGSRGGNS